VSFGPQITQINADEKRIRKVRKQATKTNLEARKPGIVGQALREILASEALALQTRSDFIRSQLEARIRETEVERF
jgi:hypothetical protein